MYFDAFQGLDQYKTELDRVAPELEASPHILIVGNGGSSAMASHMAVDLLLLGKLASALTDPAVVTALTNDFCYEDIYARQIGLWPKGGSLIAISSSGNSQNIVNAVMAAKMLDYYIVTFSGFNRPNNLCSLGHVNIHVPFTDYGIVESSHAVLLHYLINKMKGEE